MQREKLTTHCSEVDNLRPYGVAADTSGSYNVRLNEKPCKWSVIVQPIPCQYSTSGVVPASSAPSERAFSSADLIATKLRNKLTGEHVEATNLLHMDEDVLQIGLSVSVFCAFFEVYLLMEFEALHWAYVVSLPNFGFEMKIRNSGFDICDSDSIWNQLRFGYGHPHIVYAKRSEVLLCANGKIFPSILQVAATGKMCEKSISKCHQTTIPKILLHLFYLWLHCLRQIKTLFKFFARIGVDYHKTCFVMV